MNVLITLTLKLLANMLTVSSVKMCFNKTNVVYSLCQQLNMSSVQHFKFMIYIYTR